MVTVGEGGGGRDDGRRGGGFHRGRVLRGECARLRSRTDGDGARWVSGSARGESGRRGRGGASEEGVWSSTPETRVSRQCRWDIPISGVDSVVERAADRARGDDGGVATHADRADGERVGATRVRTSEADLASLWGRDMTVTRAVPDIQNTGKESTGANVRGALASVGATARVREGPGRRGFRVDGTRRRWPSGARISRGFARAMDGSTGAAPRNASLGTAERTSRRTNNRSVIAAVIQSHTQQKSRWSRNRLEAPRAHLEARPVDIETRTSPCRRLPSSRRSPAPWWTLRRRPRAWKTSRWRLSLRRGTPPRSASDPRASASAAGACATSITAAGTTAGSAAATTCRCVHRTARADAPRPRFPTRPAARRRPDRPSR